MRVHVLLLAAVLVAHAALTSAQVRDDYAALTEMYIAGRGNDAIGALASWPRAQVTSAAKAAEEAMAPRAQIAAAMLHTETAASLVDAKPFEAAFHVDTAHALLVAAGRDARERERVQSLTRRWYYFVATLFVSAGRMQQAAWYIREGRLAFPGDASLYLARGTMAERAMQIGLQRDLRHDLPESPRDRMRIEDLLKRGVDDYQRALHLDGRLAAAHLHVGWVRLVLHDKSARAELQAAIDTAVTDHQRYLGHLFLGGLDEHEKKFDDARNEYERALAAGPAFQTAYLALSRAEEALGHSERARQLANECAQLQKIEPDPWWDFAMAFDRDALLDLRAEARRQ